MWPATPGSGRLLGLCLAAGALAIVSGSAPATQTGDALDLREQAMALVAAGDDDRALAALRRAIDANPHNPYLWRALGRAAARLGRREQAVAALEQAYGLGAFAPAGTAIEIARVHAAAGRRADALRWIGRSLDGRRCCRTELLNDAAFAAYRDDPEFRRLAAAPADGLSRDARWQADLEFLVEEAKRMHVGPDRPAHGAAFAARAGHVRAGIPGWTDTRVAVELRRLVTMLGDGHSSLSLAGAGIDARRLPVDLYLFDEGVFVVGAGTADLIGRRVLRVGDRPVLEVLDGLAVFVPRDNDQGLRAAAGPVLTTLPYLDAIGVVGEDGSVRLDVEDRQGRMETVHLAGAPWRSAPRLSPPPGVATPPRDLRGGPPFWTERLAEGDALYLNFSAVADGPAESLEAFGRRLKNDLARDGVRTLIVDVRMNSGGNSFLFNQLVRTLVHFEQADEGHRIFVLIGRHTFSAAQNFISVLDQWTDAVFVGEPSGSRPNFTGESSPVRLPYSGLTGTISTRNHQNADWEDRRLWIAPDIPAPPTAADYFAGRDAAMEAVLRRINDSLARKICQGLAVPEP
jgi:hypothetical protein